MTTTSFLRITAIGTAGIDGRLTLLTLEDGSTRTMAFDWVQRHRAEVGGYLCEGTAGKWYAKDSAMTPLIVQCVAVEVAKLALAPGDVLSVKVDRPLSNEQVDRMSAHLRNLLPEGINALITGPGVELGVIKGAAEVAP